MNKNTQGKSVPGWDLFPRETVFKTPVVDIQAGPIRCGRSGVQKTFYFLDFPDWANIVALTPEQDMLLIRQFRYGTGKNELEIPGGIIEPGENPVQAGCRELFEECGYEGKNARIIGSVCPNPALQNNLCYTILVEEAVKTAQPKFDDMEDIELILRPLQDVLTAFTQGSLEISHGLVLNALSHYRNMISGSGQTIAQR